jgi:PAS domain S-box-containing protein
VLTWEADLDRHRIEQKVCTMPPQGHFGFDADRFCWKLMHDGPDAIIYADFGGLIRFWNSGAERIFGYSASEASGKSLDIIMPENLRPRHWAAYGETMRTGKTRYGDGDVLAVPGVRKDGTRVSIEFSIFPYHDRDGSLRGVGAILRDSQETVRRDKGSTQGSSCPTDKAAKPLIGLKRLSAVRRRSGHPGLEIIARSKGWTVGHEVMFRIGRTEP